MKQTNDALVYLMRKEDIGGKEGYAQERKYADVLLKQCFYEYFYKKLNENYIIRNAFGKPEYRLPEHFFNISHCKNAVAVAVSAVPIGIDVESYRKVKKNAAMKCLGEEECRSFDFTGEERLLADDEISRFLNYWTLKESYIKMTGEGIRMPLNEICFLLPEWDSDNILFADVYRNKQRQQNSISCLLPIKDVTVALSMYTDKKKPQIVYKEVCI